MGEIRGVVAKEAEQKFRQLAMKKFGYMAKEAYPKPWKKPCANGSRDARLTLGGKVRG
jgi:hypothetical protein